jgi:EAL domain-containing protein (putative c-di-GMP-specific phosphodiesterase class I)
MREMNPEQSSGTQEPDVAAQIRERLIRDLKDNNFLLYYQTIAAATPGAQLPAMREILVRFKEEEQDLIAPGTFLPLLEEHRLMPLLDRWEVAQVLRWIRGRQASESPDIPICSMNLSIDTIRRDAAFGEFVAQGIQRAQVRADLLSFELPTAVVLAATDAVERMTAPLRAAGCNFALNDFTGQEAAFDIARRLGIGFIKIDGSIIGRITHDAEAKARLMTIQQHCRALEIRTIAMQVESAETLAALRASRVDYAQGFGIDKPKPLTP